MQLSRRWVSASMLYDMACTEPSQKTILKLPAWALPNVSALVSLDRSSSGCQPLPERFVSLL